MDKITNDIVSIAQQKITKILMDAEESTGRKIDDIEFSNDFGIQFSIILELKDGESAYGARGCSCDQCN